MAFDWNVFRILADVSHTLSKCILIWAIHSNKSAEGVSLITQIFYLIVFAARYLPLPFFVGLDTGTTAFHRIWNMTLKVFYIITSAYTIFLMMRVYARTREREKAWKIGIFSFTGSLVSAPFIMMIFKDKNFWAFSEFSWVFSIVLESVCVLPQLLLLRQTTVPTVLDSFYLVTLGSYRGFYLLNWLVRAVRDQDFDPISVIFGLLQTALYVDFAWVYWTRQRVKLRGGTVVDSEDLDQGWLVKRLIGRKGSDEDEEVAPAAEGRRARNGIAVDAPALEAASRKAWGPKGISISADEGVHDVHLPRVEGQEEGLAEPDAFEDEVSEDEGPFWHGANGAATSAAAEWRDEDER